jgi:hypothetical protein
VTDRERKRWKRRLDKANRVMMRGMTVALKAEFARCAVECGNGAWKAETHRRRVEAILLRWWLATAQGIRVVTDDMLDDAPAKRHTRAEPSREEIAAVLSHIATSAAANSDVPAIVALLEAQPAVVAHVKAALIATGGDAAISAATLVNLPQIAEPLSAAIAHVSPLAPRPVLPGSPARPALPAPAPIDPPPAGPPRLPPPAGGATPPGATPLPDWDELIAQTLKQQAAGRSRKIAATTQQQVSDLLEQFAREGLGEEAARKRLADVLPNLSAHRIRTIARTEINAAQNKAALIAADARGKPYRKEWLALDDERTRVTHGPDGADGQVVGQGQQFRVGKALLDHPGDPNGPAGEVINCRCTMLLIPAAT